MSPVVLDASAVLAWIQDEPGGERVEPELNGARISSVNASEVAQKLALKGADPRQVISDLRDAGVQIEHFTDQDAAEVARLRVDNPGADLSFADRACLALGERQRLTVFTTDRPMAEARVTLTLRIYGPET